MIPAMAVEGSLFEMCLREAHLGHYSSSFQDGGITNLEKLTTLSLQDYDSYGVTSEDKKQLFRLIHTLRNLDLNKVSHLNGSNQLQVSSNENNTSIRMSYKEQTSRHANKKAIKNHSNLTSQSGRISEISPSDERLNNDRRDHNRPKLSDTPRNSVLNRTFDKDVESDQDSSNDSVTMETVYNDNNENLKNGVNESRVHVLEHSNSGYNYGVPSASPITPSKLKSGLKSGNVSTPHGQNGVKMDEKIKVCVRKRPMNQKEWRAGEGDAVSIEGANTALVKERKLTLDLTKIVQVHKYHFDEVFHETCGNEEVYERTAKPLIHTVFNRGKATCFAYGQTGAGKTHTLLGDPGGKVKGLYLLAVEDIFNIIRSSVGYHGVVVYVGYFEIYCGQLCDLLNNRERVYARENAHHRVCIAGLNEVRVNGPQALIQAVESGNRLRVVGVSGVNDDSSRSHAILQIQLKDKAGNQIGKLSFIDLAGSERACDMSDPDKITRQEGAEINTSLLALKECIRALDQEKRHTPFRQSKLTQVLRDSFLGQSRTCMIACVSPNASAVEHTLNTLRYADRVKELRQEGQFGNTPPANSSIKIRTKYPPTPSNFSPGSTSTPQKTKSSKQEKSSAITRISSNKKGDLRRGSASSPGTSTNRNKMESRRKSAPDTSPTKSPPGRDSGTKFVGKKSASQHNLHKSPPAENSDSKFTGKKSASHHNLHMSASGEDSGSKFAGKKSASHHNLQKSAAINGHEKMEKVEVVQRLKYDQVSNGSGGSKSTEKRKVIQSGIKFRENRTLEERRSRATANRSRYEEMNLSLGSETPSKRTSEVRARMKKAFLNSSLPVWDLNNQEMEAPSPSKVPPPQVLEFENPRYVESPSKDQSKNLEDQRTWSQKVADDGNVSIPYRFDVPNPRYSQRQGSTEDIESGYLPDMDTEIETPRSDDEDHDHSVEPVVQELSKTTRKSSVEDGTVHDGQNETTSSMQLEEVQEVIVSSDGKAYSKDNDRRTRTLSSESRLSSQSDSSSTVELLAEIERSLQRSPVPVNPKPGSEPWMRAISEDKFHGSEVSTPVSPRRTSIDRSKSSVKKELFGSRRKQNELQRDHLVPSDHKTEGNLVSSEDQEEPTRLESAVARNASGIADWEDHHSENQKPSIFKEKLQNSGFSHRDVFGNAASPHFVKETVSENLQMHSRSQSGKTDIQVQSLQSGHLQTRSAWGDGSVNNSRPVAQSGKGTSSQDQFFSTQSHIPVTPSQSQSSNYVTPAESRLGQQQIAISSTPKAFKHESLGMDSSLMHLSFSTIQSPGKGSKQPSSETNESFTSTREVVVGQENSSTCENVALPISPRLTITKSKSDGNLMRVSPRTQSYESDQAGTSPGLKPPHRPTYQRQTSAAERASTCNLSSHTTSSAPPNNQPSTRELLLTAHAEQLEETLRLCETGWGLIAQLRNNQMDVPAYMAQAGDLLDSHLWCLDTFRDQLNSFSRCSTPNN